MSAPGEPHEPTRVLLAEDDLFFSARLLSVLDKLGYHTDTARTQEEAKRKVVEEPPALVLLNLASRNVGGVEFIRTIKALDNAPRVVAYFSHVKIPEVREEVLAAGVDKLCANSAITMRLPDIVRQVLHGSPDLPVDDDD